MADNAIVNTKRGNNENLFHIMGYGKISTEFLCKTCLKQISMYLAILLYNEQQCIKIGSMIILEVQNDLQTIKLNSNTFSLYVKA